MPDWPNGEGEMAARIRSASWLSTSLGEMESWPEALRATLRIVLAMPQPASVCWGPEATLLYNDHYRAVLGDKHPSALGRPLAEVWPELSGTLRPAIAKCLAGEAQLWDDASFELDGHGAGRATKWFTASWTPIAAEGGAVGGFLMVAAETTAAHVAEDALAALHESEQRLRLSADVAGLGLWDWDFATGEVTWSEQHYKIQGYLSGEVTPSYEAWVARVHPDDREDAERALSAARVGRTDYEYEFRTAWPDGEIRWLSAHGRFFYNDAGDAVRMIGAMLDITERRTLENRQAVLPTELQHRVRNILATVRSLVNRTGDGQDAVLNYQAHLIGRIDALSRTQAVLTRAAGAGVELEALVREEMLSQSADDLRIAVAGPPVVLAPKAAEVLTLAIHELATNATKYGALSQAKGQISIAWRIERQGEVDWLMLEWTETGVSIVAPSPRREGFGVELITRRVAYELKGAGQVNLRPGGIACTIEFPLAPGASVLAPDFGQEAGLGDDDR